MRSRRTVLSAVAVAILAMHVPVTSRLDARGARLAQDAALLPLDSQQPIDRPIVNGERHRYSVTLAAGEFLFVVVDQRGADVIVRLTDDSGTRVAECDSPNGTDGPERIAIIAPRRGTYLLEVSYAANPASPSGRYTIRVASRRPATATDATHTEAEQLFDEAQALQAANTVENRRNAAARLQRAGELFRQLGLKYETSLTLNSLGFMYLRSGAPHEARQPLLAARDQLDRTDPLYADVLNNLGGTYDLLGEPDAALASYRESLALSAGAGNRAREAQLRNNVGVIYAELADWPAALEQYRAALTAFRDLGDRRREALALHNIGVSYQSARELPRSREFFEQALAIRRAIKDDDGEAGTLMQLGMNAAFERDADAAIARFDAALQVQTRPRNPLREAQITARLGYAHLLAGRPAMALTALANAVTLSRTAGDRREEATALIWEADAHLALHDIDAARAAAEAALAIAEPLRDGGRTGMALLRRARVERESGDLDAALKTVNTAISTFESVRGSVSTPQLRATFAGRYQDAYAEAIDLLMQRDARQPGAGFAAQALRMAERARARTLLDLLAESGADLRHGLPPAMLQRQRELAHTLNAKADRLIALQRGAASAELDAVSREVSVLETEYEELTASLRRQSPAYASLTQPEPLAAAAIQRDLLDSQTTLVEYALGDQASYAWVVRRDGLKGVRLAPRPEIDGAAREAYVLLTARGQTVAGETVAARGQRVAAADARLPAALRRVSDLVLTPLGELGPATRLAIVADGALQYLPFETIPTSSARPARPLIADFEIVTLPSASTLAVQRRQLADRPRAAGGVAVFADPVFDALDARVTNRSAATARGSGSAVPAAETRLLVHEGDGGAFSARIPRLPFTRNEANAIQAAASGQRNFSAIGFAADKQAATSAALADYRYVHFATHGVLDAERPSLSALVLSLVGPDGQPREGFLRAHEMYNLDLRADLVVLSACQTGLGKEISGEGIIGLTRGLMYAGASRVIVSLWSVSDRGTAELMGRLYRSMLKDGSPPAAALRAAQLAVRADPKWQHPYYWAPFVLQGEWN